MLSDIDPDNIALLSFRRFIMTEADIVRLLQNAEFVEMTPDESIADGIHVD
jgi:hypothetical protein